MTSSVVRIRSVSDKFKYSIREGCLQDDEVLTTNLTVTMVTDEQDVFNLLISY